MAIHFKEQKKRQKNNKLFPEKILKEIGTEKRNAKGATATGPKIRKKSG